LKNICQAKNYKENNKGGKKRSEKKRKQKVELGNAVEIFCGCCCCINKIKQNK